MRRSTLPVFATFALAFAACSSPAAAPTGAGGATPTQATAGAAATAATPTAAAVAGTPEAPAALATRMCGLLTPADIQTATGTKFGAGVPDELGQCIWHAGTATVNDGKGQLVVTMQDATLDLMKASFGSGGSDVTVGGHAAYWNDVENVGGTVWVDAGGRVLTLTFDPTDETTKAALTKLAEIAIGHI